MSETPALAKATGETSTTLLIVSTREGVAGRVESSMRNAGHPVHAIWTSDLQEFEKTLRRTPADLVMCEKDMPRAAHTSVIAICKQIYPDMPVILLASELSVPNTLAALTAGAADLCAHDDAAALRHLELVVNRELGKFKNLRSLRHMQKRFVDFQARHQHISATTSDAMASLQEGILANVNLAFAHLLHYDSPHELVEQPLIDFIAVDQRARVKEKLRDLSNGKHSTGSLELDFIGRRGKVSATAKLFIGNDNGQSVIELLVPGDGSVKGALAVPPAAGRSSRTRFAEVIQAKPDNERAARSAMLAHIDGFDALERRIGYVQALEIKMEIARRLHTCLGPHDQSFAFSAGEESLLVQRDSYREIEQFAEAMVKQFSAQLFQTDRHEAHVTLTIAIHPLAGADAPDPVIAKLVDGVRQASAKGGDRVVIVSANPQGQQAEQDMVQRAAMVRRALEFNRLKVAYQSIASLEGDERRLFELMVRMVDDAGKEWQAAEFLPAAVQAKLMKLVDRWVIKRTLLAITRRAADEAATFFVKLSEDSLTQADALVEWLKTELGSITLRNDELVFQIQEVIVQDHVGKIAALSARLREMNIGLTIDHFGIGSSSTQLLEKIPVTFVKFHASFIQGFAEPNVQKRLTELVEASRQRSIKTIVSHVEDAHVMARLWQIGVNYIQGFHVQEPEVLQVSSEQVRA
jgi:EAL domain-containing protein (putative c-di-GMP-specific phosphodiesterase class I)/GGDEF domain-containing protein/DNA-binding NarL/FixJ family response regulator